MTTNPSTTPNSTKVYRRSLAVDLISDQPTRNLPPTPRDIQDTLSLFDDFCIPRPTNLPDFATYYDLEKYRTAYIQKCLRNRDYTSNAFKKQYITRKENRSR